MTTFYQSKEQLVKLLYELVEVPSVSRTLEENVMAGVIKEKISRLAFFQKHPELLQLHSTTDGRGIITALAKRTAAKKTIVLISHFDVAGADDYGSWQKEAFQPQALVQLMKERKDAYPASVQADIDSEEWVFGRGTMDMKAGLALHISLLEQAVNGRFNGNLLLLTVPDEEVSSVGMREAVLILQRLAQEHDLQYELILNSEPIFSLYPGDTHHYIYTGSIGKMLPGFYCYGQETHVGEPFLGLNASLMSSLVAGEVELNTDFCEQEGDQLSPPPTALLHRDLKREYSVQIPNRAVSLYNLLVMKRPVEQTAWMLKEAASRAAEKIGKFYQEKAQVYDRLANAANTHAFQVKVLTFAELKEHAEKTLSADRLAELEERVFKRADHLDDRELSIALVDEYAQQCREMAPFIVLFFAPPFYPAVHSQEARTMEWVEEVKVYTKQMHGIALQTVPYFNGICDLSYVSLKEDIESMKVYTSNVPVWGKAYDMPIEVMKQLQVPVLNLGPVGRDAHQRTERLHVPYAFVTLKDMIEHLLDHIFPSAPED